MKKLIDRFLKTAGAPRQQIQQIRERIEALREERERIEGLPRPAEEIIASFGAFLDEAENKGDLIYFAERFRTANPRSWPDSIQRDPGTMLFAWMIACCRDLLVERFSEMARDVVDGMQTADAAEQQRLLDDVDAEIEALCRQEEMLIRQAEGDEIVINRRADAPPHVVLAHAEDLAA